MVGNWPMLENWGAAQIMLALPVSVICHVHFFCGISVQTSATRVQYCTSSCLFAAPVDQLGNNWVCDSIL